MRIRRLNVDDSELAAAAVREFKARVISVIEARAFLAEARHYVLVADDADVPAGFLLAYRLDRIDRPSAKMFIYELVVAERYRRRGIAKSLLAMITDIARREGMMNSFVLTNRSNEPAVALYQQMGGRIPNGDDLMFVYEN
jgi:ribosomal protein S18 acetylase RimI-like enzyme